MSTEIRMAHSFPSVDAVVSNPSSEQAPDGLAVNLVRHGHGTLGKPWVAAAAATSMSCKLTFSSAIARSFCAIVTNASPSATIELYRDPDGANVLHATLLQCEPTSCWLRYFSTVSDTEWGITVTDASGTDPLIVYFAALGNSVSMSGGATVPRSSPQHADPSIEVPLRNGGSVFNPQPRLFRKTFDIHGGFGDASLAEIQEVLDVVGRTEPVLVTTDAPNFNDRGVTVLGRFEQIPEEPLEGAMTRYPLTVQELRS